MALASPEQFHGYAPCLQGLSQQPQFCSSLAADTTGMLEEIAQAPFDS